MNYPDLPTLPEPPQPKPAPTETKHLPSSQPSPTTTSRPDVPTVSQRQNGRISQNVPSAVNEMYPASLPNNNGVPKSQNAENHAPRTQPLPNNVAQQQQLPSQGITATSPQPPPNSIPNADVSKKIRHNNDVILQGQNAPNRPGSSKTLTAPQGIPSTQDLNFVQHPGVVRTSATSKHGPQPTDQITSGQTMPDKSTNPNHQVVPTSNISQSATSLPNNQSQGGTPPMQNQPYSTTPHSMVQPVQFQPSTNKAISKNSPLDNRSQVTSTNTSSHQLPQTPSGVVAPQPSYPMNNQSNLISRPQTLHSTTPPTQPQPSMAQQLRPNVSGILPKMPTKNSLTQPKIPGSPTLKNIATSPAVPPSNAHVPQGQPSSSIPNVPQSFASSRTGMTHGLPPGWERVLDTKMGRYYFKDHNTKTTHWNPPESLTQTMNQSMMGHNTPTVKETEPKKPSLKRSLSSPNLAKLDAEEIKPSEPKGVTNRPRVNRRTKPLTETQLANLAPTSGGHGKALTGLRNLGNSCYMNSVLQCLLATSPLAKYIVTSYYLDDINKTNPLGTGGRIAEELAVLTRVAHSGNYRSVSPYEFKRTIGRFAPEFGGTKQQDSQEFLLVLLDQFHEDTNRVCEYSE